MATCPFLQHLSLSEAIQSQTYGSFNSPVLSLIILLKLKHDCWSVDARDCTQAQETRFLLLLPEEIGAQG